jgi:leukotriene-A4 hydrolase
LKIHQVKETSSHDKILDFSLEAAHQNFGTALKISLKNLSNINALNSLRLNISYETSSTASALQWLDANLTLGKKYPYLFSQCQAIHARSIMPCQDTPAVKFTYEACVKVVKPLTILMSACSTETIEVDENQTMYKFEQNIKIPSYLLAIVAGHLVSKQIGKISKVWSEAEMIERAAFEFQEVDKMMEDAENLCGKYVWGVYDLLVLPPSFPYGGMENPCLTFVTPTIIAGDRSLVTVIQHEITHSWTGNLVTNCSWETILNLDRRLRVAIAFVNTIQWRNCSLRALASEHNFQCWSS